VTPITNPNCNPTNPSDAVGFGTVVATIPVGVNPVMVDVLKDGSRAYVVNSGNAAAGIEGSVSVVNLQTNQVTATIGGISTAAGTQNFDTSPTLVYGHPNSVSVSLASPTGKVYITSPDNKFMTVLRTDTDAVTTHISLQGLGLRVLVTAP
jgi:DNA-binding beta-propeller fold protein YncE